jgi:hypothetical protein
MAKVFISYRHVQPDEDLANCLASFFEAHNFEVFIDRKILTGQRWVAEIERQIRTSQHFVALLSAESVRSDMVGKEIKLAYELSQGGGIRILPVRIDYSGALPMDLGAYLDPIQHTAWTRDTPFEPTCDAVLAGIRAPVTPAAMEATASAAELEILARVTDQKGAPLPSADPRLDTGAVRLDSPFYVRRRADQTISQLVLQEGVTVLVKGPRQVGKTSLLARAQAYAKAEGLRTFYIDFQLTEESRFASLDTLLRYLAVKIAREFRPTVKPGDIWDEMLGATDNLTDFLEQALLEPAERPIVFAFDEVDNIFKYDKFRNGFFAMIRGWHNRRAMHPVWNRLNVLIGHSTEPALFIDDLNQSPFNVGEVIRLGDFTQAEIETLNEWNGRPLHSPGELAGLASLVGGQPYLIRQAFYCLRTTIPSLAKLKSVAADDGGPFGDHLRRLLWNLQRAPKMQNAVKGVLRERGCEHEAEFQRLRAAGLISGEARAAARIRCDLYREYFTRHL